VPSRTREQALVRGPLLTIAATAWLLNAIDTVSNGGSAAHGASGGGRPMGLASTAAGWLLMLAAMAPLLTEPVRHLRVRSLARRRARVITLFVVGYLGVWLVACGALTDVAGLIARTGPAPAATALAVALAWGSTPARGRCLNRAHAHPALPAFGLAGDLAALRFGLAHGVWCVGTCWALMLLPLVVIPAAAPAVMAGVALWLVVERLAGPEPPAWGLRVPAAVQVCAARWAGWWSGVGRRPTFRIGRGASHPAPRPDAA
jgi:predicted metal-binding membrane protein